MADVERVLEARVAVAVSRTVLVASALASAALAAFIVVSGALIRLWRKGPSPARSPE